MQKTPIILIPGIQGTKLANINKKNFDLAWSGLNKFFDNLYDLLLKLDGQTDESSEVVIERQDVEDLAYSEIINYLKSKGYPVYIFGYDWRKSNIENGGKLADFVDMVMRKHNPAGGLNFLTHSMGCLVFSGFLKAIDQDARKNLVNKAIFTVPPFLGSIEAMFNLIIGKSRLFNSSDDFRKIARTFPAIFELCPVYDGAVSFKQSSAKFNIFDQSNWQQPRRNDIKRQFQTRLAHLGQVRDQEYNGSKLLFDFSQLDTDLLGRMLVVAGVGDKTQHQMTVEDSTPENVFVFSQDEDDRGDGTVHLDSARVFENIITTLTVESRWLEKRFDGRGIMSDWHSFFLNNGRVQNIISRFLNKSQADLTNNWFESIKGEVRKL